MNKNEECAIFQDLYDLYMEEEVEGESKQWMMEHEANCTHCQKGKIEREEKPVLHEDSEKIWGIRIMTTMIYCLFFLLSIWMSIWYLW
ncbi:hypothetical protein [Robertmurraya kyonggiensis]|uniref:Zinc-finger n=1 Tax=Robertmurraya kyonggiensis TaxID=1037680 RepID=A0A4U1DA94_9BACI|nr:hypothetical protein [Robertmurraya kyonggiensis]TKC19495.1 hypothetical protein FA727_08125 [Robertmurraya kyonggiensis]